MSKRKCRRCDISGLPLRKRWDGRSPFTAEVLEKRLQMSATTNVLTFHNDGSSSGVNSTETTLTPANVKPGSFGKLAAVTVDGNVFAEPLVMNGVTITAGPNTTAGSAGVHNIVFVATENGSVYAIDTTTYSILWQRSFLTIGTGTGTTAGTDVNNPLSATAITAPTATQVSSADSAMYGITGTPVIDPTTGIMYVVAFTAEIVNGNPEFVQRLHALNLSNGTDIAVPYSIGESDYYNDNTTNIYVYADGEGSITDPYNNTGKPVVQFNALVENQREGLSLENNTVYVSWAAHGDDNLYHGWIASWNVGNIMTAGFTLSGVFCSTPNGGGGGIWDGGGKVSFEPDGSAFYFATGNGNGASNASVVPETLNSAGFPSVGSYTESVIKMETDPTTSAASQSMNGWGMKVVDYFIPYNQPALDAGDFDLGSGAPLVLPASAGIPGHPNLLVVAGKQGTIYVIDRDDMGHFNPDGDNVLNSVPNGSGVNTPNVSVSGALSTPVYFNSNLFYLSGYNGATDSFTVGSTGLLTETSQTTNGNFGYIPGSPVLSADGTINGILWVPDRNNNQLHAYDVNNLANELWNSSMVASDEPGTLVKFNPPTVANGDLFLGTTTSLVIYGLLSPATAVPIAPVLTATVLSESSVNLHWTDSTIAPNTAAVYSIEQLIGGNWTVIATMPTGSTSLPLGALAPLSNISFRVRGINGDGFSAYSSIVTVTTTNSPSSLSFATGFTGSASQLTFNGNSVISGSAAQLVDSNSQYEAGSVFSNTPVDVTKFSTTFSFHLSAGAYTADGFTFTIEGASPTALGSSGGALGYGSGTAGTPSGIERSVAVKFDLFNDDGEGADSTGLYVNGNPPTVPSVDMSSSPINLHSGDLFQTTLAYNGTTLSESILDTTTNQSFNTSYLVNIPAAAGSAAYVGFTAGTGGVTSVQQILNWTFNTVPTTIIIPAAPGDLTALVTSGSSVSLTWTNNATNETGVAIDRATNAAFTQNLITQTLPGNPNSFIDINAGLSPGGTYYYRIRATNLAGSSASSAMMIVVIPAIPAVATNAAVTSVTAGTLSLSWTDNAGTTATGYSIYRAVNHGTFSLQESLPASTVTAPSQYAWTDTGLSPGSYYDYQIECFNISGSTGCAETNATTLTNAPTALTAVANASGIALSWTAPAGAVSFNLYQGTLSGDESLTPIATGLTGTNYTDTALLPSTQYYFQLTAVNANASPLDAESDGSVEASATSPATVGNSVMKLIGAPIGVGGSYAANSTYSAVFDGNFTTFWDPANGNLTNWVGLDLGSAQTISQIKFAPRAGYEWRMYGAQFQVSNNANFSTGVVTLYTIPTTPVAGEFTTISVNPGGAYRYIRYTGGIQWVNIAEMEVDGPGIAPTITKLTGAPIGVGGNYSATSTYAAAFDGSFSTYFDPANGTLTDYTGLDLYTAQTITQIKYAPRAGYEYRMVGGEFQASNSASFSTGVVTLYTILATPVAGQFTTVLVSAPGTYRYVRYTGGTQWVNIAEMEVDGIAATTPAVVKLTGAAIGAGGAYSATSGYSAATDGSFSTYFDPANGSLANWVGLDLGSAQTITQIKYAPRAGYEFRMVSGEFQVSNTADFSSGVVTLYTITTAPVAGQFTTVMVSPPGNYRYIRYTGGNQWVNIAEMEVDGYAPTS